ncbi:hypothetical protein PUNSTDRAFT_138764 [Punctularia strigosozonata HHB-11173 SS5]|uniref:Uncharacterized protein n=1 Tax=Punctularia strigosozonata (strain HHB-11173) TaxID=741275 RepID=R7S2D9_PUNST|nr:uncharacterized protein PUNSTDRAFT_138764 [Punctularia strigosozonata HHB-11173 SS5]EIN04368.1 hypothetical protein PUNSTDRAFT_138764 [Punctularia strigosozonata HHB-11173 SS5]
MQHTRRRRTGCFGLALEFIRRAFPFVEHLRLSGIESSDRLPAVLRTYLAIHADSVNTDTTLHPFYKKFLIGRPDETPTMSVLVDAMRGIASTLRRLYLQPHWHEQGLRTSFHGFTGRFEVALNWLMSHDQEGMLVVLPAPDEASASELADSLWLANAEGFERCWSADRDTT